jgi:RNA polymerase sigma factor (sigma-70 family)
MGVKDFTQLSDDEVKRLAQIVKNNPHTIICDVCSTKVTCPCQDKNETAINILIKSHAPLALSLAKRSAYLRRDLDELVGVAFLTLTRAVHRIPELSDISNIGAYIRHAVKMALRKFILTDGTIRLRYHSALEYKWLHHVLRVTDTIEAKEHSAFDLQETIQKCVETETENIIAQCLLEGGYHVNEIAAMCNLSPGRISQIKIVLGKKLEKVL